MTSNNNNTLPVFSEFFVNDVTSLRLEEDDSQRINIINQSYHTLNYNNVQDYPLSIDVDDDVNIDNRNPVNIPAHVQHLQHQVANSLVIRVFEDELHIFLRHFAILQDVQLQNLLQAIGFR